MPQSGSSVQSNQRQVSMKAGALQAIGTPRRSASADRDGSDPDSKVDECKHNYYSAYNLKRAGFLGSRSVSTIPQTASAELRRSLFLTRPGALPRDAAPDGLPPVRWFCVIPSAGDREAARSPLSGEFRHRGTSRESVVTEDAAV